MDIVIHRNETEHQISYTESMAKGMRLNDCNIRYGLYNTATDAGIAVIWGWRQERLIEEYTAKGTPIIVMERGYLGDRTKWTSIGINGLNGKAKFPDAPQDDKGARFKKFFSKLVKDAKTDKKGYALVIGQVADDVAVGQDYPEWLLDTVTALVLKKIPVIFRPHPLAKKGQEDEGIIVLKGVSLSTNKTLGEDLKEAAMCFTYSSTSCVEAILSGTPTYTHSPISIAYDMCPHNLNEKFDLSKREKWFTNVVYRQWTIEEIEDGTAWKHVRKLLECKKSVDEDITSKVELKKVKKR